MARSELDWNDQHLGEQLTSDRFGGLADQNRDDVEQHLMECDACWEEFQRLDAAVRTLRFDAALGPVMPVNEVVSLLGLSSRLDRPFGGHAAFVLTVACLCGLEWTIGLWSELGYAYDRFGGLAWTLSVPVAVWVAGALLGSLSLDVRATRAGRLNSLARSGTLIFGALAALVAVLMLTLPTERTILASFQTRTAAIGYLKDAGLIFLPLLLVIVPTFHAIIWLQRELRAGRAESVLGLLTKREDSVVPRGMWYLSPQLLTSLIVGGGVLKVVGGSYMLDALKPGPYAGLFSLATYASTGVWLVIGVVSLAWYSKNLNELKREAKALVALTRREPHVTEH